MRVCASPAFRSKENIRELQFEPAIEKTMSLRQHFMSQATRHSSSSLEDAAEVAGADADVDAAVDEEGTYEAGKYSKEEVLWALGMVHSRSFSAVIRIHTIRTPRTV